ncbi:T9SS type A sorting domain-containing protein, partial [bacterium]|nr:T9SS type A sorting domain-containing protein [bacterium]
KIRWSTTLAATANENNNVDIRNIKSLRDSVISDFSMPSNIPCFSLGFSDGANFSDICASALSFRASAHIAAKGIPNVYSRPDLAPVIWIMSENDQGENADNAVAFDNYTTMRSTQVAEWHWFRRSPAYSQRFVRSLNNVSEAQSDSVFARLLSRGYLTSDSMLTYLSLDSIPAAILNSLDLNLPQKGDIRQQLQAVNADHVLHSDFSKNIIRFFNQTHSPTSIQSNERDDRNNQVASVYPNPFVNKTTIAFRYRQNELYTFRLFNILGQVVQTISNISSNRIEVRRKNLTSGMYFYQLRSSGKIHASGKLIIM